MSDKVKSFEEFNKVNEAALDPDPAFNKELMDNLDEIDNLYDDIAFKISASLDMLEDEEVIDFRKIQLIRKELDKALDMRQRADLLLKANVINKLF